MKKLILASLFLGQIGYCATNQPTALGNASMTRAAMTSNTLAVLATLTPDTTTQLIGCTDCTQSAICVSSGVTRGAWVVIEATGPLVGSTYSGFPKCQ